MKAKTTSKLNIVLPIVLGGESVDLLPSQKSRADEVRTELAELGVNERDVAEAMKWARKSA